MIRTVALGVVCLTGLGAIAAVAKKSPPPPPAEVVMPVVAGNKGDRLPFKINQDTLTEAEKWMSPTFRQGSKAKPVCLHRHQRKSPVYRIPSLLLVIGTIRMI